MKPQTVAQAIASTLQARKNCERSGNREWETRHGERLDKLVDCLPSGSGIDNGTTLDRERTTASKIVMTAGYHHMNDGGYYDGWTHHTITILPGFDGISVSVSGRNRNQIKEYLSDVYHAALSAVCTD